jgi:hypothetical protein
MLKLILHGKNCNLLKNEYGFFEVWSNGRRLFEILTENEKDACEQFIKFTGETWQPVKH